MLDFRIESFLAVCKHLSYTKASQEFNLSQPAISQHIQYLQNHYKVKFFQKENNKLTLTPEGILFRDAMISLRQVESKLEEDLLNLSMNRFQMRFGSVNAIAEEDLLENLGSYLKHYPNRNIQLAVNNTEELLHELDAGTLHFAIVEDTGFDKHGYEYLNWAPDEIVCVCAASRTVPQEPLPIDQLYGYPLILATSSEDNNNTILQALHMHRIHIFNFDRIFEIDQVSVAKQMVIQDIGICFISKKAVQQEIDEGILKEVPIQNFNATHSFLFIWRKGNLNAPLFKNMYEILKFGNMSIKFDL